MRYRFNPPPNWPPAPPGWSPTPGWRPDPSWPPAPPGWTFWVAEEPVGPSKAARGGSPPPAKFDAFVSDSHALDGQLAPALQTELERFGKPWYRARARRVFRDNASLSANPQRWLAIEGALASSRWFVLLASPAAASSTWVDREVRWWLANRGTDRLLIVLTGGELGWDPTTGRVDPEQTTALPPALVEAMVAEPSWVDLRWAREQLQIDSANPSFRDCVADILAAVIQAPKDALVGEHVRRHRQTMRLVRGSSSPCRCC